MGPFSHLNCKKLVYSSIPKNSQTDSMGCGPSTVSSRSSAETQSITDVDNCLTYNDHYRLKLPSYAVKLQRDSKVRCAHVRHFWFDDILLTKDQIRPAPEGEGFAFFVGHGSDELLCI